MELRPYKFQIVAICQDVDDDGRVLAERPVAQADGRPLEVFGLDGLREFTDSFEEQLRQAEGTTP